MLLLVQLVLEDFIWNGLFLKEKNKKIKIALSDPFGSGLYNYYQNGEMKSEGNSITEEIGQGRVTKNLENCPVDLSFRISDNNALTVIFDLLKDEGYFLEDQVVST